jgi:DNA-binding MarR family transcriptional regulator
MSISAREAVVFRVPDGFEEEWPESSSAATEVVLNIVRLGENLTSRVDALVRDAGLPSPTALVVLEVLRGAGEPLLPSELARRSFLSRPTISGVLDTLERRGLIERHIHPDDRRRVLTAITPEGKAAVERVLPELHRAETEWAAGLSEKQQHSLLGLLGRMYRHVESLDEQP